MAVIANASASVILLNMISLLVEAGFGFHELDRATRDLFLRFSF
jgi:hypothetical protein